MTELRIERVQPRPVGTGDGLHGASLDGPTAAAGPVGEPLQLFGWALGRSSRVEALEVSDEGRTIAEVAPNEVRPDIGRAYPEVQGAENSGFRLSLEAQELPLRFTLEVVARLEGGERIPVGTVAGSRSLAPGRDPAISPLMLTTIGRSGSKWLAWLLSCHPSVVAYQPLVFESRLTTYWTAALRSLSAPQSYERQIHAEEWDNPHWWLGEGAGELPGRLELGMGEWLGGTGVDNLAAFCQQQVEAFYLEVGRRTGKPAARYFAEKFLVDPVSLELTTEIFPDARELILVRDFRDRLSSVFAWNEKIGDDGFGHDTGMSRAEYLAQRVTTDAEALLNRWRERGEEVHLVRYEDLILNPRRTLTSILEFLDVDAGEGAVAATLELANRPQDLLDKHRTVSDPAQTIGRWRRDLPADLAAECNEILAPVLGAFGYATDLEPASDRAAERR